MHCLTTIALDISLSVSISVSPESMNFSSNCPHVNTIHNSPIMCSNCPKPIFADCAMQHTTLIGPFTQALGIQGMLGIDAEV